MKLIKLLLCLLGTQLAFTSSAAAAEDKQQQAYISPWLSACNSSSAKSEKICTIERRVFSDQAMTKKMASIVFRTAPGKPTFVTILSPLGALISEGVQVEIQGQKQIKLPFLFCEQVGCISQTELSPQDLDAFAKAKTVNFKYQLLNAQKAIIAIDMTEFKKSFEAISQ
ncbi:COG5342 Invasion protein B, involved in pathogenesis [Methylophilaceae bacterium]